MNRADLAVVTHLIAALQVIAHDNHDTEDADDSDHPGQRGNWAMRATMLLEEVEAEFYEGARCADVRPLWAG